MATFAKKHRTSRAAYSRVPFDRNGCTVFACARALADDPADDAEVADLAGLVVDELRRTTDPQGRGAAVGYFDESTGTWSGPSRWAAERVGLDVSDVRSGWETRYVDVPERDYGRIVVHAHQRVEYHQMTVAQFLRANPDVTEAIFCTTAHTGYYRDGASYSLGARKRVNEVTVLATSK